MKIIFKTMLLAAAATIALAAGQAQAGLITVTNVAMPINETVNLNSAWIPGQPEVYAGRACSRRRYHR